MQPASPGFRTRSSSRGRRGEERKNAHTSGVVASRIVSRTYERSARPEKKRERARREVGTPLSVGIPYEEKDRQQRREQPFFRPHQTTPSRPTATTATISSSTPTRFFYTYTHRLLFHHLPRRSHPPRRPRHFRVESIENLIERFSEYFLLEYLLFLNRG